jgi:hypothetical protein
MFLAYAEIATAGDALSVFVLVGVYCGTLKGMTREGVTRVFWLRISSL